MLAKIKRKTIVNPLCFSNMGMENLMWMRVHNVSLTGSVFHRNAISNSMNLLFLPLSISSILSMSRVTFPIEARITHYTPLLIERSRTLSGSLMAINSYAALTLDRTDFTGKVQQITSPKGAPIAITHCRFLKFDVTPIYIQNTQLLKVKWCVFDGSRRCRAITVLHSDRAIIDTCNFTSLESGAVELDSSTVAIKNCRFVGAHATSGAAIHSQRSVVEIHHTLFQECHADESGGAVSFFEGTALLKSVSFADNEAEKGNSIYNENARVMITDSVFDGTQRHEVVGDAFVFDCKFKSDEAHLLAPPTSTETFTPVATASPIPPLATEKPPDPGRNMKVLIGCCAGIGGGILVIAVIVVIVIKVKGYNTPKIYVKEMTEKKPPSGSVYVSHTYSLGK